MTYDSNNIFAKILAGDIPAHVIYENDFALAFHDVAPKAPIHALVIPKGSFTDISHFLSHGSLQEIAGFWDAVHHTASALGLPEKGFRLITNQGNFGGQEVPHCHVHLLGGHPLGPMISE